MRRLHGFTVIELLIVVAIVGVIAAMVFPAFTHARTAARTSQCLTNVKTLAQATAMYLDDFAAFPPSEHEEGINGFFDGCQSMRYGAPASVANPYLQWPVLLDPYLPNRQVWRCPNAKLESQATFILSDPQWFGELLGDTSWRTLSTGPICSHMTFPSGWGGAVNDSISEHRTAVGVQGAFLQSIGTAKLNLLDRELTSFHDPAKVIVVGDAPTTPDFLTIGRLAYPDICCAECSGLTYTMWGWPDPNGCPDGSYCPECVSTHAMGDWITSREAKLTATRHSGGTNVGFADGHAAWYRAETLISESDAMRFAGVGWECPSTSVEGYQQMCGPDLPDRCTFLHKQAIDFYGNEYAPPASP